jgi:hypothetical protein
MGDRGLFVESLVTGRDGGGKVTDMYIYIYVWQQAPLVLVVWSDTSSFLGSSSSRIFAIFILNILV